MTPTPTIKLDIPTLTTVVNDDGGLDIIAGTRVIGTLSLANVESFSGVTYYDLDIRPRSYVHMAEDTSRLRAWTRFRIAGTDQVLHYPNPPKLAVDKDTHT